MARVLGIILIIGGLLGLIYGGFSFTKEKHEANIGPVELSVAEKERVNIPLWVGIAAVVGGAALLLTPSKR